ncbi:hypothetical protein DITRI_Ditri12bG0166000 [Diplodiscus trichospermus]
MYATFSQISLLTMSNSEVGIEFDILKRPTLEFQEECQATATSSSADNINSDDDQEREVLQEDHGEKKGAEESNVRAASKESEKMKKKISLGEIMANDDDNDGFRTPTSLDHKIPAIKQCPPAPRKPKPLPSNKRKASASSSNRTRSNLHELDLSHEVESLFPMPLLADLHRKVKKARTEDNQ